MNQNLYLVVLKALLKNKIYTQYWSYIDQKHIDQNYPEIYRLYQVVSYLNRNQDTKDYTLDDLQLGLLTLYPKADTGFYNTLLETLKGIDVNEDSISGFLSTLRQRAISLQIAKSALQVAEGTASFEELKSKLSALEEETVQSEAEVPDFVSNSLVELNENLEASQGFKWRLTSLNTALGPIRKGNFGFIFARPETGKTTILSSEITYMAAQTKQDVIWFNNEQAGKDVMERVYQAHFGITTQQIKQDRPGWTAKFQKELPNFHLVDDGGLTKWKIEQLCKKYNPALIIFDQIDKIKGFTSDRYDLEMKEVYQWARELSKKYGPVIGVCQAGGSGEGKKWLTMNDVDSSKTAKQGEADYILGIGKIDEAGSEYLRFMHLSKNKLNGDDDTDPTMRHGRFTVFIRPEIARYMEIGDA